MRSLAPIVYFAYNRPEHTRLTLEALSNSDLAAGSILWIYIDGPKAGANNTALANITAVKKIAAEKKWCGEVHIVEAKENKGLFRSIVDGITAQVKQSGKVIVLEDDVLVSKSFLTYMNDALELYEQEEKVMHISGFSRAEFSVIPMTASTYFYNHTSCWGWATWKRAWDKFIPDALAVKKAITKKGNIKRLNMDNTFEIFWGLKAIAKKKFQSWNTIWHSCVFLNDGYCLHPTNSLVSNIGHDGSGTNCVPDAQFGQNQLADDTVKLTRIPIVEDLRVRAFNVGLHSYKYRMIFLLKHYARYFTGY